MAEAKGTSAYKDMLDIIFADRNRDYGAYQLRRSYPQYVGRALGYGLALIILFFAFPFIMSKVSGVLKMDDAPIDVVAELGPPPDIDPNNPPPPPPPPPPTPPPPTRSTIQFVPPIVKKDEEVADKEPPTVEDLIDTKADIGKDTKEGNDEAPPAIETNPSDLIVEAPKQVEEKTYEMFDIQKPPSFPGGETELLRYLAENIKYPPLARENNIQGSVVLSFVIGKKGEVTDVSIIKDIGGGCGKEAVRVVQAMPKWSPGEAAGNPVKVRFTLPVRFKLE
ncbi:MAG: TonB family protein [Lewinellaceae bacterium]|nr:TonB family protein [Lewinellaceae bacterium]